MLAFHDISEMIGKTFCQVQRKAEALRLIKIEAARAAEEGQRRVLVPLRNIPRLPPSALLQPSQAALMAGRASSRRVRSIEAAE